MKPMMKAAMMPLRIFGSTTLVKLCSRDAPSSTAASSISTRRFTSEPETIRTA
ncbi:hypothetical protein D3C76_1842850 [compost metagenome]